MKTIRHTATLFYYDGPQVFEARDGGHYVAMMVEPEGDRDRYLSRVLNRNDFGNSDWVSSICDPCSPTERSPSGIWETQTQGSMNQSASSVRE